MPIGVAGVRIQPRVRSVLEIRNAGVVRQRWDYSCGSAALSTVLTHHLGDPTPESAVVVSILRRADPVRVRSRGGFSLLDLKHYLARRGYSSEGYAELTVEELDAFAVPPIVPIQVKGYAHFVVFRGLRGDRVILADPSFGNMTMHVDRFREAWSSRIAFVVTGVVRRDSEGSQFAEESLAFSNTASVARIVEQRASSLMGTAP